MVEPPPPAGRPIAAAGARADAPSLRRAYLDLLKLGLCDLVGSATTSVQGRPQGELVGRELSGEERRLRAEGRDWPLHGLTMTSLERLDDLQACVEGLIAEGVAGDLIETGTWRGGSSILMRATLDSLGAHERTVWLADSFAGFPTAEQAGEPTYARTLSPYFAAYDFLAAPLAEVRESFARLGYEEGLRFVPGFFEDTLPGLAGGRWSLIRLDGDSYDATMLGLRCLYPGLAIGGQLIVDDYGALEECRAAVDAFRAEHGIEDTLERVDWTCVRWRRATDAGPASLPGATPASGVATGADPTAGDVHLRPGTAAPARRPVRSAAELELAAEVERVRAQLSAREGELARARAQLAEVTASTCWRLTAPLRAAGARARARL